MSDAESTSAPQPAAHPSMGGKSLDVLERPRYKSWRKKYRKMRVKFDQELEDNRLAFKEEHKLHLIAKRLREELDGLLELCLDLNQSPQIPAELRFDVRLARHGPRDVLRVPEQLTLEEADMIITDATKAVAESKLPPIDLHVIKQEVSTRLAMQNVRHLDNLQSEIKHTFIGDETELPVDMVGSDLPGYMTLEQEDAYLQRLDERLDTHITLSRSAAKDGEVRSLADLPSKELERQHEIFNPQSQYNWLKTHTKLHTEGDEVEALNSQEVKQTRRRGPNTKLAKQVGDRAVGKAREGHSPGVGSGYDDDELSLGFIDDHPAVSSGRKKAKDPDGPYRSKSGKSSTPSVAKGKRKRNSGDDAPGSSNSSAKKAKVGTSAS